MYVTIKLTVYLSAMFAWPPVVRYLIDTYSWRGASLIISGICLNGIVFGSLLRPPPRKKVYKVIIFKMWPCEFSDRKVC